MTGAPSVQFQVSRCAGAAGRFRLALALSALTHLLLAAALVSEALHRNAEDVGTFPIAARLGPLVEVTPGTAAAVDREAPVEPHPARRNASTSENVRYEASPLPLSARAPDTVQPLALPQVPDATVYAARDLDSYPRLVVPLDIDRLADRSGGLPLAALRLELIIDEHGIVNHVAFVQSEPPGYADERLLGLLAAARFVPAYKDRRAVKTRLVLSINFEISDR